MKKILLTLASAILATSGAMAEEAVFNFLGTTDKYGLTFQSAATVTPDIETPKTITQDFAELTMNTPESGGYALGGRATSAGLWICGQTVKPSFTISVEGGTITEVSFTTSSSDKRIYCGGTLVPFSSESYPNYVSTWNGASNSITFDFDDAEGKYDGYRITNVTVVYSFASGDQKEPDLSFSEEKVTGIVGESFDQPVLSNPYDLPITWSSSNENIATVDQNGNVDLVGGGKVVITAYTAGNKDYASGFASYEITVIPVANDASQLPGLAPQFGDKVVINFPMYVTYVDDESIWTIDDEENAAYLKGENTYQVGSFITPGWTAVNNTVNGDVQWTGDLPEAGSDLIEILYPEVESITSADHARVVWLKGVVLNEAFGVASGDGSKEVTLHINGESIILFNLFGVAAQEAGTYNVLGVVDYKNTGSASFLYFYPTQFVEGEVVIPMVEKDEVLDLTKFSTSSAMTEISELPYELKGNEVAVTLQTSDLGYQISSKGIYLTSGSTNTFTVSASDRQISKIVINCSDWFDNITVGGTNLTDKEKYTSTGLAYTWERPSTYSGNDVEVSLKTALDNWNDVPVTLYSIQVYYMDQSSGLDLANLSVKNQDVTISIAEKTYDAASNINNPKYVDLTWASSNSEVATVKDNVIEIVGAGTATLTASVASEGFEPEEVAFDINVINAALTVDQMEIIAPEVGDKVHVNSTLGFVVATSVAGTYTVTEPTTDEDGNETTTEKTYREVYVFAESMKDGSPVVLYKNGLTTTPSYNKDANINGNWDATNATTENMVCWGGVPNTNGSTLGWIEPFNEVETLEGVTEYRVVVLKNATLNGVPVEKGYINGTLSNGDALKVYSLVNRAAKQPAGIYDLTGIMVKDSEGSPVFYPAAYTLVKEILTFPESFEIVTNSSGIIVNGHYDEEDTNYWVEISGETNEETVEITAIVPEGWDGFISMNAYDMEDHPSTFLLRSAIDDEDNWMPIESLIEGGCKKTNTLTYEPGQTILGAMYLYKGEKAYIGQFINISGEVSVGPNTSVEGIDVVDADAEYFTLQGVKVQNPDKGIYIKVSNGKATKVVR